MVLCSRGNDAPILGEAGRKAIVFSLGLGHNRDMEHGKKTAHPGNPASPQETPGLAGPLRLPEGRHVLHAFFQNDDAQLSSLTAREREMARENFLSAVEEIRSAPETQLLLFSVVSHKADWGFLLICNDLHAADAAAKRLPRTLGPGVATPVFSWYSITELSEYTTTEEQYAKTLCAEEGLSPDSPIFSEKLAAFRERMAQYARHRLYPLLPEWPVLCFYPMSKRRNLEQNWYSLPFEKRQELMLGHARVGRNYAGRVLQLVTGSTGLDSGEWGVTLLAKNPADLKAIVYEMRFDPASATYADFGDFFVGLLLSPPDLLGRLSV